MLNPDAWLELFERLGRARFRTALTMFSVAWGILMLVLLLAAGKGLENNVRWQFRGDAINSIWIFPGRSSIAHEGHGVGRPTRLTNADHAAIAELPGVEHLTSRYHLFGEFTVAYQGRHGAFEVRAVNPPHRYVQQTEITAGRYINELDILHKRKVAVIGDEVVKFLFRGRAPIGEAIDVGGLLYTVVGTFHDEGGPGEMRVIDIPLSTAQVAYGGGENVHRILFTVGDASLEQSKAVEEEARLLLASRHDFSPRDQRALRIRNNLERYERIAGVFTWLRGFIWIVGIGTVLAGVVGVSNIMLVSVQERTSEIGLRKALGATPASIVAMILQEAIVVTSIAGYGGLVVGVVAIEAVRRYVPENDYVRDPGVDLGVVFGAVALLVVFGTLAGLFPALRAARVNPIVALRSE